jgi:type IV secretory pathway TraG/TraD family ATPase VirD4
MSNNNDVKKFYSQRNCCLLCQQPEEFSIEDPLISLCIHQICLELLAANLPTKFGKNIMKVLSDLR